MLEAGKVSCPECGSPRISSWSFWFMGLVLPALVLSFDVLALILVFGSGPQLLL